MMSLQTCSFSPWFGFCSHRKIQGNSNQTNMCYYKPSENVQSAYWPDVSGAGGIKVNTGKKVLCSGLLENMSEFTFIFTASCKPVQTFAHLKYHAGSWAHVTRGCFFTHKRAMYTWYLVNFEVRQTQMNLSKGENEIEFNLKSLKAKMYLNPFLVT